MVIVDTETSGISPEKCSLLSVGAVDFDNPKNRFYEECRIWNGAHIEKEALKVNGFTLEEIQPQHQKSNGLALPSSTSQRELRGKSPVLPLCPTVPRTQSAVVSGFGHALGLGLVRGLSSATRSKTSRAEDKKSDREVVVDFLAWLQPIEEKTLAGQNPSFDRDFLQTTAYRYHINWPLAHRTIDLHTVAYSHMLGRGIAPPKKNQHSDLGLKDILKYVGVNFTREKHNALEDALLEAEALSRLIYGRPLLSKFSDHPIPKNFSAIK